jgi:hypothetical protein
MILIACFVTILLRRDGGVHHAEIGVAQLVVLAYQAGLAGRP